MLIPIFTICYNIFMRKKVTWTIIVIFILLSGVFLIATRYKSTHFRDAQIDEILFYFSNGLAGGQSDSFWQAVISNLPLALLLSIVLLAPILNSTGRSLRRLANIILGKFNQERQIKSHNLKLRYRFLYGFLVFVFSIGLLLQSFSVPNYLHALSQSSTLYEDHYVDPRGVQLTFPEKKRNLIYIYLESMENTVAIKANGGMSQVEVIPELEKIALNNTSFSHNNSGLGGAQGVHGTAWTVAGMTATSAGVPLKDGGLFGNRDRNSMGEFNRFLPGAYTLGEILKKEGYNQSFVMGSDSAFGGRDKLLKQHGDYKLLDLNWAYQNNKIPKDYKVWWGYEDKKLFEFAREEATRLSKLDQPFNLQMLTVDSHFTDGWLDETCEQKFAAKYDNVHACSSKMVGEFIAWVQQQPFYENTTIIITGDHLGMQTSYYDEKIAGDNYTRTIYNAFINSVATTNRTTNRQFTSFDIYPTTLAALGVKVGGDRMGLGVNLYSDQRTLLEKFGDVNALNHELTKRSSFYERKILSGA